MGQGKTTILDTEGCSVYQVRCDGRHRGWSATEELRGYGLVLVRGGRFKRRVRGRDLLVDNSSGYLETPGQEQQVAHPTGGDVCTAISFPRTLFASVCGGDLECPPEPVYIEPRVELAHRLLIRTSRLHSGAVVESLVWLLAEVCGRIDRRRLDSGKPTTRAARARVVDEARDVLAVDPDVGLLQLARTVGVSPHHLSRVFSARMGQSISRYRIRLRVRAALDRLGDEVPLATIAADVGFSDQAHLARSIKAELGETPSRVRQLLRGA